MGHPWPGRKTYRRHRRKSSRSRADCGTDHKKWAIPIVEFGHGTQDVRTVRGRGAGGWVLPAPFVPATRDAEARDQPRTPVPEYEGVDRELSCVRHIRHGPRGALGRRIPVTGFGVAEARCRPRGSAGCPPGTPTEQCRGAGRRATRRADRIGAGARQPSTTPDALHADSTERDLPAGRVGRASVRPAGPRRRCVDSSGGPRRAWCRLVRPAGPGDRSRRRTPAAGAARRRRCQGARHRPTRAVTVMSARGSCGRLVRAGTAARAAAAAPAARRGRRPGPGAGRRPTRTARTRERGAPVARGAPARSRQRLRDPAPPRSCRPPTAP